MAREHKVFAEQDGWTVIDSFEYVPAGRYEVRDPEGRQYGIWETVESAKAHMIETIAQQANPTDVFAGWRRY